MKPNHVRSLLWALAAAASAAIAVGLREAGRSSDPVPALVATLLAEACLGVAGFLAFAARVGRPAAHTRGRWAALDGLRSLVALLLFGFLVALLVATFLGVAPGNPWLQVALLAPGAAALLCVLGALLEFERFVRVERAGRAQTPGEASARKVYETRTGAVLVEERHGQREIVLTGRSGRRDVDDVERAIDERGWQEGETPAQADLHSALQRWGILRGTDE